MSRDEIPSVSPRGLRFVVSSHLVLCISRPVFTQFVRILSDVSIFFARSFPLERQ